MKGMLEGQLEKQIEKQRVTSELFLMPANIAVEPLPDAASGLDCYKIFFSVANLLIWKYTSSF